MVDTGTSYRVHGEVPSTQTSSNVLVLKRGARSLQIQPEIVHVREGGHVSWWIWDDVVPDGGSVEIEFDEQGGKKGPFKRHLGDATNPERGLYRKGKARGLGIVTQNDIAGAWTASPGYWKYTVRVFDAKGVLLIEEDPGVAIDEDPDIKPTD